MYTVPHAGFLRVYVYLVLSSDHFTPATGKTVAVELAKYGSGFASIGNASELGNGFYIVDLTDAETDSIGTAMLVATASGCDLVQIPISVGSLFVTLANGVTHGGSTARFRMKTIELFNGDGGAAVSVGIDGSSGSTGAVQVWSSNPAAPAMNIAQGYSGGATAGVALRIAGGTVGGKGIFVSGGAMAIDASPSSLGIAVKRNTALGAFPFFMRATDGSAGLGKTVTAQRMLDGGAFASCANTVVEVSDGYYKIDLDDSDLDGATVALLFTAPGCQPTPYSLVTQP